MEYSENELNEFTELISQDLQNGEVDKIAGLFSYNRGLYPVLARLMQGDMFVRLGVNMLMEILAETRPEDIREAIPILEPLLRDENPTIRGDVADIISIIGGRKHIDLLKPPG